MLQTSLFKKFNEIDNGVYKYIGYQPIGHPMILYSLVTGFPLASLHIKYKSSYNDIKYKTLVTELNESNLELQQFQGIFTKDNEDIEFVITNLCSEGFINFNLMKNDIKVTEVDPGGLNQVNELAPFQSYAINADQTVGNKSIRLSVNIKKNSNNDDVKTSLQLEVSNKSEEKVGSYLYLSVIPRNDVAELCEKFKDTIWKPSDYIILRDKSQLNFANTSDEIKQSARLSGSRGLSNNLCSRYDNESSFFEYGSSYNTRHYDRIDDKKDAKKDDKKKAKSYESESDSDGDLGFGDLLGYYDNSNLESSKLELNYKEEEEEEEECFNDSLRCFKDSRVELKSKKKNNSFETSHPEIYKSHVANIVHGDSVKINTQSTGYDYAYDLHSRKCVLGLSVYENLLIAEKPSVNHLKDLMTDFINKLDDLPNLLKDLKNIYISDCCCVCLEESPNSVLYKCGHKCLHFDCSQNIDKCPLCREHIYCKIKCK